MDRLRSVYLAGPEVFLPDAAAIGRRKRDLCQASGFAGLFPLDEATTPPSTDALSRRIYTANMALIEKADFGIFNLTPFRGPSADVGTVFELGVFIGMGKPVFAYSNLSADLLARVAAAMALTQDADAIWWDGHGMSVEDFGNADNLMIDEALARQGRTFHRRTTASDSRYTDLRGFEACLQEASDTFFGRPA